MSSRTIRRHHHPVKPELSLLDEFLLILPSFQSFRIDLVQEALLLILDDAGDDTDERYPDSVLFGDDLASWDRCTCCDIGTCSHQLAIRIKAALAELRRAL